MARKPLTEEQIAHILQSTDFIDSDGDSFDDEDDIEYQPAGTCTSSEEDECEDLVTRDEQPSGKIQQVE